MTAVRPLLAVATLGALAAACNLDQRMMGPSAPTFDRRSAERSAALVLHVVSPQTTDLAIDRFLDPHYVWLDTAAQSNHRLLLFMPGSLQVPAMYQLVQQEAARLGYHVIGLNYPSGFGKFGFSGRCPTEPEPSTCYENARLEILTGADWSPIIDVTPANSIDNRLTKLLEYLVAEYPDEGWSQFLVDGAPHWPLIAVAGHSQGGGQAAIIAKIRLVARVVLFSSVTDSLHGEAPSWETSHVTPLERYYGIAHDRDMWFPFIRAGWDSIGLAAFGAPVDPATSDAPYGWARMLITDVTPVGGFVGTNAHGAPCHDANTPLQADGTPLFRDAWDYLLAGVPRRSGLGSEVATAGDPVTRND